MTVLASIQPCYLPWRGYFHIIQRSDVFVFADNLQYTKQNWRNRNRIKTESGGRWIVVPVDRQSTRGRADLNEVLIDNREEWGLKHWRMIDQAYHGAPFFGKYSAFFEDLYKRRWENLVDLDIYSTREISRFLKIETEFLRASDLDIQGRKTDYLIDMCRKVGATHYLTGPSARDYIEEDKFRSIGVTLEYQSYDYPEYPQLHGKFADNMSVVDILFNCGEKSPDYIWAGETESSEGDSGSTRNCRMQNAER
jgi:hypothetical protein